MRIRKHLLVTGFGPFPGMPRNPSGQIARQVAASPRWRSLGIAARAVILTTSYAAIEDELEPLLRGGSFEALLMVGVSGRAKRVQIERRATNRASVLFDDESGVRPSRVTLGPGPGHRRSGVPALVISVILRRRALPCAISQNAGRYLCNAAYFRALAVDRPALFLHIPKAPPGGRRAAADSPRHRSAWSSAMADGFVDVAIALLRQARRRRAEGTEVAASAPAR